MRVAALADVHGNIHALEAVLADGGSDARLRELLDPAAPADMARQLEALRGP
jgi:hypothetical protein